MKVLRPADSTIRRIAHRVRRAFRARLYDRLAALLSEKLRARLDDLLVVDEEEGVSDLQVLKEPPGMASPRALKQEAGKLDLIEGTGALAVDLSWIRQSLRKALARRARRSDAHRLRELEAPLRGAGVFPPSPLRRRPVMVRARRPRCVEATCTRPAAASAEVEAHSPGEAPAEAAPGGGAPVGLAGFTVPACWSCAETVRQRVAEICRGEEVTVRVVRLGASAYGPAGEE